MKIFITGFNGKDFIGTKLGQEFYDEVKIDPFVGCFILYNIEC